MPQCHCHIEFAFTCIFHSREKYSTGSKISFPKFFFPPLKLSQISLSPTTQKEKSLLFVFLFRKIGSFYLYYAAFRVWVTFVDGKEEMGMFLHLISVFMFTATSFSEMWCVFGSIVVNLCCTYLTTIIWWLQQIHLKRTLVEGLRC